MSLATAKSEINYSAFPAKRTKPLEKKLLDIVNRISSTYNIKVYGLENIPQNSNCIISSNHISNLDPFVILAAFGESYVKNTRIATLAALHTMSGNMDMFNMIGSIPVDREGNTLPAVLRCDRCLKDGYDLILFPEGARSRDGSMLPFKTGAAELSIRNEVPILPIKIDGMYEVFPRGAKKPMTYDKVNHKKYDISITIGTPIWPGELNAATCTNKLQEIIASL